MRLRLGWRVPGPRGAHARSLWVVGRGGSGTEGHETPAARHETPAARQAKVALWYGYNVPVPRLTGAADALMGQSRSLPTPAPRSSHLSAVGRQADDLNPRPPSFFTLYAPRAHSGPIRHAVSLLNRGELTQSPPPTCCHLLVQRHHLRQGAADGGEGRRGRGRAEYVGQVRRRH